MPIRPGRPSDLPCLLELEARSFGEERRENQSVIRRSLASPHQEVWVATRGRDILGALFLRCHPRTLRVYSIAVDPDARGSGIGGKLLDWAEKRARQHGCGRIVLEADARDGKLLVWYQKRGYATRQILDDYYAPGWSARRLCRNIA